MKSHCTSTPTWSPLFQPPPPPPPISTLLCSSLTQISNSCLFSLPPFAPYSSLFSFPVLTTFLLILSSSLLLRLLLLSSLLFFYLFPFSRKGGPAGSMKGGRQIEASKEILGAKNVPYIVAAPLLIQGKQLHLQASYDLYISSSYALLYSFLLLFFPLLSLIFHFISCFFYPCLLSSSPPYITFLLSCDRHRQLAGIWGTGSAECRTVFPP